MTRKTTLLGGSTLTGVCAAPASQAVVYTPMETNDQRLNARDQWQREREELKERQDRAAAIIKDQLEHDIALAGACGPLVLSVTPSFTSFNVMLLQWQPNNLATEAIHDFKAPLGRNAHHETALREATTLRFEKILRWQAAKCAELGTPYRIDARDIDLSVFTMDAPLAAMLEKNGESPGGYLRNFLAEEQYAAFNPLEVADYLNRVENLGLSVSRTHVHAKFVTGNDQVTLKWSKGSLAVFGLGLSQSVMQGCIGKTLQEILQHPWFTHPMTITAVSHGRWKGMDGIALDLRDTAIAIPSHW